MAYNTNEILKDKHGNPISQYYNSAMDRYEPLEGVAGANKVTIKNNPLSLIPILETLERLTGTVVDEETRKDNEVDRENNEDLRQSLYQDLLNELVRIEAIDKQVPQYILDKIGDMNNLTTVEKDNLVNAINEINNKIDNIDVSEDIEAHNIDVNAHEDIRNDVLSNVNNVGSLDNLITDTKTNTVGAINEVKQQANDIVDTTYGESYLPLGESILGTMNKVIRIRTNSSHLISFRYALNIRGYRYSYQETASKPILLSLNFNTFDGQVTNPVASSINTFTPEIKYSYINNNLTIYIDDDNIHLSQAWLGQLTMIDYNNSRNHLKNFEIDLIDEMPTEATSVPYID